eukprot:10970436-Alexandrium_andersonii.AAC.1
MPLATLRSMLTNLQSLVQTVRRADSAALQTMGSAMESMHPSRTTNEASGAHPRHASLCRRG